MPADKLRTFIAISLPAEIKDFLGRLQEALKVSDADVNWVKKENIHLTLKFLGERDKKKTEEIIKVMDGISQKSPGFHLEIASIGAFPKKETPRVVWSGLSKGDKEAKEIARELENEIAKLGIPKETREFSSHITLGRVRSAKNRMQLVERLNYLEKNFPAGNPRFKVEKITLFKSTLTPHGPIYEVLYESILKAN